MAGVIAVAGEALVDLVPAPVGGYFEIAPGGSPANVALGLARLGVPARLLARIADDLLGKRIREHLTHNGVQLDHAVAAQEQTSLAMVSLDADGFPAYDFRIAGTADWQWTPPEVAGALDAGPTGPVVALHSGSLALTTAPGDAVLRDLLMRASETVTVSYDPNCRPMLMGNPEAVLERRAPDAPRGRRREGQLGGPALAAPGHDARAGRRRLAEPRAEAGGGDAGVGRGAGRHHRRGCGRAGPASRSR